MFGSNAWRRYVNYAVGGFMKNMETHEAEDDRDVQAAVWLKLHVKNQKLTKN